MADTLISIFEYHLLRHFPENTMGVGIWINAWRFSWCLSGKNPLEVVMLIIFHDQHRRQDLAPMALSTSGTWLRAVTFEIVVPGAEWAKLTVGYAG
jgi:hypothetical protein